MTEIEKPPYPLADNLALVDENAVRDYLELLFSRVFWKKHHFVCIRGIGEKGTWQEGRFRSDEWVQPGLDEFPDEELAGTAMRHANTWAQWHVATFIVPAVLKEARGTAQAVDLFTALVVDLDSGDTNAKAAWLDQHIGTPSMVVASGGTTELGTPKLHVYYVLEEPEGDVGAVVEARHQLALKAGGDLQFGRGTPDNPLGRAHQPIRIPGTVHAKNGKAHASTLLFSSGPLYDFAILAETIRRAPAGPWAPLQPELPAGGAFAFGPTLNQRPDISESLMNEVHEGGEDKTRWTEFSRVAGFNIGMARRGEISLDQAKEETHGWMLAKMVPPWPDARFEREWSALVRIDVAKKGAMPAAAVEPPKPLLTDPELGLFAWAAHRWTQGTPPARRFLVDGLIAAGKPHLLVAEGGAGKTFSMLDLALKVSSFEEGADARWWGQPIREGGTVVMLTTEDDADELHIRLADIDADGARFRAGNRLIVLPLVNAGGAFTLADRDKNGKFTFSPRWKEFLDQLKKLERVKLVIVDTLNTTLHGDENSATVVSEYARMLQPVCGEIGAALVVTHHIRKQDTRMPIITPEDMAAAVRGSSALPAAFRAVLGVWHCHDFAKRLAAMDLEPKPKQLWRMGVLKANNPEMIEGVRFLLRAPTGLLEDATARAVSAATSERAQQMAWLTLAIRLAAEEGCPYTNGSKNDAGGLYKRRHELPPMLRELGWKAMDGLRVDTARQGEIVVAAAKGQTTRNLLDIEDGPFAKSERGEEVKKGAMPPIDWSLWRWDDAAGTVVPADAPTMIVGK